MARYRCKKPFWFNFRIWDAGEEVEYAGLPSDNLEPLDDDARAKVVEAKAHFETQRQAALVKSSSQTEALLGAFVAMLEKAGGEQPKRGRKPAEAA
jgi:hypothetical protein